MFWVVNIALISIIIFLLFLLTMVWPPDSPWSPWWRTNKEVAKAAGKLAKISSRDVVYELGSGDGQFLITAVTDFYVKRAVGIEIDPTRVLVSKLLIKKNKLEDKIEIIKDNFFNINISSASVVFVYLVPRALERILPKLKKELKHGTKIVSLRYEIKGLKWTEQDKKHKLYLYKI